MKRLLSTMIMLGALAGTAAAAPYVLPSPQTGDLTPYDWQPVYSIEGIYSIAEHDAPDTYGIRGSFSLYSDAESTFRHQFSLNIAPAWGSEEVTLHLPEASVDVDCDLFIMPVTLGYTLNIEVMDDTMLYLGAKAGYAWCNYEESIPGASVDENAGGFTYSVGAGIKFQCNEHTYVQVGYEFGRSFLNFDAGDAYYNTHTISVGVGCTF